MAALWSIMSFSFSLLYTPFLMLLLGMLFLASIGKSIGIRRLYVQILLKIFEYGRQTIEIAHTHSTEGSREASDDEADSGGGYKGKVKNNNDSGRSAKKNTVISREDLILCPDPELNYAAKYTLMRNGQENHIENGKYSNLNGGEKCGRDSDECMKREFELSDCLDYIKTGVEAIIEDQVTSRFEAEELKSWNLLTRTNHNYEFISWRLTIIWMFGFLMRYTFLLPLRVLICFIGTLWLTFCTAVVGYFPEGNMKRKLNRYVSIMCFGVLSSAISAVINYHNVENRPKNGICVANHTSPIDVLVLACDNCYALIGQRHGGFLGILQRALARASPHIWFERSEVKDRHAVAKRLKEHVSEKTNPPILIFPEGTCINNTSVMQFKKGSFEVGGTVYPVAIKYDARFGDAFWNSSKYSMLQYMYCMMTSWAIVCDVWYLPPMHQNEGESSIDFANRVKRAISEKGGLVDLMWDGQLKRSAVKKEWKEKQQEEFSKRLKVE